MLFLKLVDQFGKLTVWVFHEHFWGVILKLLAFSEHEHFVALDDGLKSMSDGKDSAVLEFFLD